MHTLVLLRAHAAADAAAGQLRYGGNAAGPGAWVSLQDMAPTGSEQGEMAVLTAMSAAMLQQQEMQRARGVKLLHQLMQHQGSSGG